MNENDQHLINCIEFIVRRIVREELNEIKQNKIDIEDYRDSIDDMIYDYISNRVSVSIEH